MTEAYNMDCMDYMRALPDKSFDLAVCDPPYFSGPERRKHYGRSISTTRIRRPEYPIGTEWHIPDDDWYQEVCRVSKEQIIWGINYFHFTGVPPGRIIWDKCNGSSTFSDCEIASASMIKSTRLWRYMWNGMMQGRSITEGEIQRADKRTNEKRIHPTQKPVDLYKWLFTRFVPRGGVSSTRISARGARGSRRRSSASTSSVRSWTRSTSRPRRSVSGDTRNSCSCSARMRYSTYRRHDKCKRR